MRIAPAVIAMWLAAAGPLSGQWRANPSSPPAGAHLDAALIASAPRWEVGDTSRVDPVGLSIVGTVGMLAGIVAGGYVGTKIENARFPCSCDDPGLSGMIIGAVAGPAFTTPTLVHLANRGRGSLSTSYAVSLGIAALGTGALLAGTKSNFVPLIVLGLVSPILQVPGAVWVAAS